MPRVHKHMPTVSGEASSASAKRRVAKKERQANAVAEQAVPAMAGSVCYSCGEKEPLARRF